MVINALLKDRERRFIQICKQHNVKEVYAFGSSITEAFDPQKSDIDLIVELNLKDPIKYGETLLELWDELEAFFNRKVDLLTEDSIHNPILRKNIEATKRLIYDGKRRESSYLTF